VAASLIIIGSRDPQIEEIARGSGRIATVTWLSDLSALMDVRAGQPDVLLVDVRRSGAVPSDLSQLKRNHPSTNVVLLASRLDPAVMLQGMRAGVNECITDPVTQAEFEAAIGRLLGQRAPASTGAVFAFVGAKGGVGTTTTAVNVAATLAKLSAGRALLMDLHLAYGDAAVFLGANARFSVLDALENLHRLDGQFLKSLIVSTPSGLDLLASADRPATRSLELRQIGSVVQLAAGQYPYVVLDVPRSDLGVLDNLDSVKSLVVVANQELATVRNAGRMAAALRARYHGTKVTTIINRTDGKSEIGQRDVERAVGGAIAHQLPSDYRRALTAMHKGRPLALDNHNNLSASIKALAHELAGVADEKPERGGSGGLKGLLSGRR
jgi:pilus assembly protein CpaE